LAYISYYGHGHIDSPHWGQGICPGHNCGRAPLGSQKACGAGGAGGGGVGVGVGVGAGGGDGGVGVGAGVGHDGGGHGGGGGQCLLPRQSFNKWTSSFAWSCRSFKLSVALFIILSNVATEMQPFWQLTSWSNPSTTHDDLNINKSSNKSSNNNIIIFNLSIL